MLCYFNIFLREIHSWPVEVNMSHESLPRALKPIYNKGYLSNAISPKDHIACYNYKTVLHVQQNID